MSEDRKKIIAKLIKLKALAERGVGGEQATAQLMYDTLKFYCHCFALRVLYFFNCLYYILTEV